MRCELTDFEWAAIKPTVPNKARRVPRADHRPLLNGINTATARVRHSRT